MLASQLIYTSWKNGDSPKKGYMVYSKSTDITTAEADEIHKVMRYEAPSALPFTPTADEIETIFPKNVAFFRLASGRYCIAQSSYVGQDYTGRWGNYLYHAFVVDDMENMIPANFIGSGIFKTRLTEAELNAPSDPPPLPKVEINDPGVAISEKEINSFFNTPEKKNILKKLLRGVLDSMGKTMHIYFTEATENLRYWIGALSLMIPRNQLMNFTFSTYVISTTDNITLSCMYPGNNAGFYGQAYTTEILNLNAEKDGEPEDVGVYADLIVEKLLSDYYDTVLSVNEIVSVMNRYNVTDCDLAAKILGAVHGNYSAVKDADEFVNIFKLVCENPNENAQQVAEGALAHVVGSAEINASDKIVDIYRYLYQRISDESKKKLMMAYTDKTLNEPKNGLYESFKASCPCSWQDALAMFSDEAFMKRILAFNSQETGLFAALVLLDMYTVANDQEIKKQLLHYVLGIYGELVKVRDEARFDTILKRANAISPELSANVFVSVISGDMEYFHNDVDYLFNYLERRVASGGAFWTVLTKVVTIYPDVYLKCAKCYIELEARHPDDVARLGAFASRSAEIKDFVDCTLICKYDAEPAKTKEQIMDGYRKFVCVQYNRPDYAEKTASVFRSKVATYLGEKNAKNRVKEALYFFESIFGGATASDDGKLFATVCDGIFSEQTLESIARGGVIDVRTMIRVHDVSKKLGVNIDPKSELYIIGGYLAHSAKGDQKSFGVISGLLQQGAIDDLLRRAGDRTACDFVALNLDYALHTVYTMFETGTNGPFEPLFEALIIPLSRTSNFISEYVKSLKGNSYLAQRYMGYVLNYLFTKNGPFKEALERIADEYLDSIGKSKRREIFDILLKTENNGIEDKSVLERYMNYYEQNHKGFWGKIFGGKKKGD